MSVPPAETALYISDSFLAGLSGAAAALAWAQLPSAQQHTLTAVLARLQLRLRALQPLVEARADAHRYAVAERLMAAACTVDHMVRAMNGDSLAGVLDDLAGILDQRFLHMGGPSAAGFRRLRC
ncbi:hypothetical protein [Streptomyces sp. ME18-1-4]|uniref:hypothetical protein n=1 Tax=Streptomyces sp. ME18-1-4 TaxID=3028685 RepID=UPI0029CA09A3|nr:hypothetical protein [Streptomyces sp. ME18-1-4]